MSGLADAAKGWAEGALLKACRDWAHQYRMKNAGGKAPRVNEHSSDPNSRILWLALELTKNEPAPEAATMTEFDKEIVKAAEAVVALWSEGHMRCHSGSPQAALERAVAAKREAERPKLMTVEEAFEIYMASFPKTVGNITENANRAIQAVLTEERKRTLAVIEALPVPAYPIRKVEGWGHPLPNARSLADIRAALQPKS